MTTLQQAIAESTTAAAQLQKSQAGFEFAHANHAAYDRRSASGTISHVQAKGTRRSQPTGTRSTTPAVNPAEITRFSSGMTSITELKAGTSVLADSRKVGLGIDIGLLTAPAMKALANGIVNHRARVFIDSGAFSLFRKNLKALQTSQQLSLLGANEAPEWKTMDFDKVLEKYEAVMDAIEEANPAEEQITPPYFVMPDIIGDQAGTTALYHKHRDWIRGQIQHNPNCIVPLQAGDNSLADAYREITGILGVDNFIVGIPSQEEAVSNKDLIAFLKEIKPARIHFLGAVSDTTLGPRIDAVNASGHTPDISADGNILRSKLYGQEVEGKNRHEKVATVLKQELPLGEVYSQYLEPSTRSPHPMSHDLHKAIEATNQAAEALQKSQKTQGAEPGSDLQKAIAKTEEASEALLKSHVKEHTRVSASGAVTQVSAYDDKRKVAHDASEFANEKQRGMDLDKPQHAMDAADAHMSAASDHIDAMHAAHKEGRGDSAINEHFQAASRHLQAADSLRNFHRENAEKHSVKATAHAFHLSAEADQHDRIQHGKEHTSESLNHGTAMHLLAMEQHQRAHNAKMAIANKHYGTAKGDEALSEAKNHSASATQEGKEVQRLTQISIGARDAAHEASKKADASKAPEDHKAAAEAHRKAASLDWDSETKAEHEKKAQELEEKAKGSSAQHTLHGGDEMTAHAVTHKGEKYHATGKEGHRFKDGVKVREFSTRVDTSDPKERVEKDARIWLGHDGKVEED